MAILCNSLVVNTSKEKYSKEIKQCLITLLIFRQKNTQNLVHHTENGNIHRNKLFSYIPFAALRRAIFCTEKLIAP